MDRMFFREIKPKAMSRYASSPPDLKHHRSRDPLAVRSVVTTDVNLFYHFERNQAVSRPCNIVVTA